MDSVHCCVAAAKQASRARMARMITDFIVDYLLLADDINKLFIYLHSSSLHTLAYLQSSHLIMREQRGNGFIGLSDAYWRYLINDINTNSQQSSMNAEPRKYVAKDIKPQGVTLKEIPAGKRREVQSMGDKMNTIVIDCGSENIKAGYDWSQDGPELVFRPQISKNRDASKADQPIKAYINTSYDQLDLTKTSYKSPYQRNLVLHFSLFEQCNDYLFGELAKPNKRIRSPLIISEPFANPLHCRSSLLQQFFECYEIDSVMIGVDALFAYFYEVDCNLSRYESETALIVSMGATTIHIAAMIEGKVDFGSVRRLNIGGNNAFELFGKSILLKNQQLKDKLTYSFLRDVYEQFTSVAIDYKEQLRFFQSKFKPKVPSTIYHNKIDEMNKEIQQDLRFIQEVEIDFDTIVEVPEQELKRKQEVRKRMSEKLKETLARRKEMKQKMHEAELKNYLDLKERYEAHDKFAHEQVAELFGEHHPHDKLIKKIHSIQLKLGLVQEKGQEGKFNLINIPDHELPPEKIKYKKLQIYQKQALEQRKQKQIEREQEEGRMRDLRENNPEVYLTQLKQKYKAHFNRIKENQRIKNQLNNRKSKLKQRKMQAIARITEQDYDPDQQIGEDDWLAYRDPEESDHYSELQAMEAELREIDPEWTQAKDHHHLKETNQLFLLTDLVKCHEIYFQPLMIGLNQIDLVQTITSVLSVYPTKISAALLANIIVVGGGSVVPGLKERLQRDLTRQSPVASFINVHIGKGGLNGAFLGMQHIGRHQREFLQRMSFKRQQYLSGSNLHISNPWSNPEPTILK